MLIHADVKSLELVAAAYLSQDPVMKQELSSGFDIHADNQARFELPDRRTAKVFVFKLIYGGTAFGYAKQQEFQHISKSPKHWEALIEKFYRKYRGIKEWHEGLVRTAIKDGLLTSPTGRQFNYPSRDVVDRLWYWRPKILNYPVQGLGADLVSLGRVTAWKRLHRETLPVLWQSTVHDSVDIDVPNALDKDGQPWYNKVCKVVNQSINDIPTNFYRVFGKTFDVPVGAEVFYGNNLKDLTQWHV